MADAGKNAITTHSGTGSRTNFPLTWTTSPPSSAGLPYLAEVDVLVVVDAAEQDLSVDYVFSADGLSIDFKSGSIPASGADNIVLTRVTPHVALVVTWTDSAPATAANFQDSFAQTIYYTEEVEDKI